MRQELSTCTPVPAEWFAQVQQGQSAIKWDYEPDCDNVAQ